MILYIKSLLLIKNKVKIPYSLDNQLHLIAKLTLKKALNALKNVLSYLFSKWTGIVFKSGLPITISIEPTTSCNLRCPECPSGLRSFSRATGMIEKSLFNRIIDELSDTLVYLTFYFQGEPYLHPQFLEMVKYASSKKIYTMTSTNGHYLNDELSRKTIESGLDRIIISIDGITQEVYEQYRIKGKLNKVLEGTKNLIAWKKKLKSKTPFVIFQFLVVKPNEHQIEEAKILAKEIGVDSIVFKTAQIYDFENGSDLIPTIDKYSRYKRGIDGKYAIKNRLLNHCWKMWHSCVITWNGDVVPCCFDKDATHTLGSLKYNTFNSIWRSSAYNEFRRKLASSRKEIDICKNCTEGMKILE